MDEPDFLICLNCETPCYTFEWQEGKVGEILCTACGAEDPDEFATEDDLEALATESETSD